MNNENSELNAEIFTEFAEDFAAAIISQNFYDARQFLALWLQQEISENDFQTHFENHLMELNKEWEIEQMIYPSGFSTSENSLTLDSLKEYTSQQPDRNIPSEINEENFRKWMVIQFLPDENDERIEFDAWFDFWFILVEKEKSLKIGYFEFEYPD